MDPSVSSGGLLSPNRPMPPHLTSAVAEQILAQACENENQNAKRLRLGLEPISQPLPVGHNDAVASSPAPEAHSPVTTSTATTNSTNSGTANLFRPAFGPYQRSNNVAPPPTSIHQGKYNLFSIHFRVLNGTLFGGIEYMKCTLQIKFSCRHDRAFDSNFIVNFSNLLFEIIDHESTLG